MPSPLSSNNSSSFFYTLCVILPYVLSKFAIAANNAYLQYLFGSSSNQQHNANNNSNAADKSTLLGDDFFKNFPNNSTNSDDTTSDPLLSSEATILQWEFLLMGLGMGGLRAVSVMTGKHCSKLYLYFLSEGSDKKDNSTGGGVQQEQQQADQDELNQRRSTIFNRFWFRGLLTDRIFQADSDIWYNRLDQSEAGSEQQDQEEAQNDDERFISQKSSTRNSRSNRNNSNSQQKFALDEYGMPLDLSPPAVEHEQRNSLAKFFDALFDQSDGRNHIPNLIEFRQFCKLRAIFVTAFLAITAYGIVVIILLIETSNLFSAFKIVENEEKLEVIQKYCNGFAIGVLPTFWLYATEQFLLGCHASGLVFIYGVIYAGLSTAFIFLFASSKPVDDAVFGSNLSAPIAFGLGLGMSVGAWLSYILLHLHLTFFDRFIFRDLCTMFAVFQALKERFVKDPSADWRASFEVLKSTMRTYLGLAAFMGLSNLVGLLSGLVVAAMVLKDGDDDASKYYSIASAYYTTLAIGILGASSAISALVASANGIAKHFQEKLKSTREGTEEYRYLLQKYEMLYSHNNRADSNLTGENPSLREIEYGATTSPIITGQEQLVTARSGGGFDERIPPPVTVTDTSGVPLTSPHGTHPRNFSFILRSAISRSILLICLFALLLAIPPMIFPKQFINFFGKNIDNFNQAEIDDFVIGGHTHNNSSSTGSSSSDDVEQQVYDFLIPSFLSFVLMTVAMSLSASLHALYDVALPFLFHVVAYTAGCAWTIVFANKYHSASKSENESNDNEDLVVSTYGTVLGPIIYGLCLTIWLVFKYLRN